jgi:hypothetical protein
MLCVYLHSNSLNVHFCTLQNEVNRKVAGPTSRLADHVHYRHQVIPIPVLLFLSKCIWSGVVLQSTNRWIGRFLKFPSWPCGPGPLSRTKALREMRETWSNQSVMKYGTLPCQINGTRTSLKTLEGLSGKCGTFVWEPSGWTKPSKACHNIFA